MFGGRRLLFSEGRDFVDEGSGGARERIVAAVAPYVRSPGDLEDGTVRARDTGAYTPRAWWAGARGLHLWACGRPFYAADAFLSWFKASHIHAIPGGISTEVEAACGFLHIDWER